MLFVIKLQKLKEQQDTPSFRSTIPHKQMNPSNVEKTHPNYYWVFSEMVDLLSLIPRSSTFQDGG